MTTRICKICKKEFIYKHKEITCSNKCRKENKRQWSKKYWSKDDVKEKRKSYKKGDVAEYKKKWQSSQKGKDWWKLYRKKHRKIIQQRVNNWNAVCNDVTDNDCHRIGDSHFYHWYD